MVEASEVTDHIIPKEICGDPWDQANWQPLCKKCHQDKAPKDKKLIAQYRKGIRHGLNKADTDPQN